MDQEEKELLQATFNLAEENNKMLHKVRGVQKRQAFLSVLKVLFFVGLALGAFYFLEPYFNNISRFIEQTSTTFNSIKNILPK
jgi:preprotein translocase subunit SecE